MPKLKQVKIHATGFAHRDSARQELANQLERLAPSQAQELYDSIEKLIAIECEDIYDKIKELGEYRR